MLTTCFRFANYDTPLRVLPGQRAGRFNDVDDPPTQYLADHPLTPWAEFLRWSPSAKIDSVDVRLWALRVDLTALVHIDFDNAKQYGLAPERLVSEDRSDCRDLAAQQRQQGAAGLVVPSAALAGTRTVVLFGALVLTRFTNRSPARDQLPGAMTADHARPPQEVVALHRRRGTDHAGLAAWRRGQAFVLPEPVTYSYL